MKSVKLQLADQLKARPWISQSEAAKMRGVTRQAIARLVKKGRFTTLSIAGKTLLSRSEIEEFKPRRPGPAAKTGAPRKK